jgi:hypothetical protein
MKHKEDRFIDAGRCDTITLENTIDVQHNFMLESRGNTEGTGDAKSTASERNQRGKEELK